MLRKCIKHEWLATARNFLPMLAFVIVLTPIFSLIMRINLDSEAMNVMNFFGPLGIFGFAVMIIGIYIATYIFVITRFYRTTATSEAYLTFTLPVSVHHILLSKWLVALFWQIISAVLAVCAILAMTFITGMLTPEDITSMIHDIFNISGWDMRLVYFVVLFVVTMIFETAFGTLEFYCAIMLGQLITQHRVLASIGFYAAIYTATQFVSILFMIPLIFMNPAANDFPLALPEATFYISIVESIILGVVCYIVSAWIMKKHLNVQ